jgi:hypothetical protein
MSRKRNNALRCHLFQYTERRYLLYTRIVQGAHHVLHKLLSMRLRRPLLRHLVPSAHHHEAV